MSILLVEDNPDLSENVIQTLTKEGFIVKHCITKEDILFYCEEYQFDLILLDILLPDTSGFELIEILRKKQNNTPILVISALSEVDYRIKGLDLGADDYLPKPFHIEELIARSRALIRRKSNATTNTIHYQTLGLDIEKMCAHRDGQVIELKLKEFQLLDFLIRNAGHVKTRSQILDHVWGIDSLSESNTVDVHVRMLRRKIDDPFEYGYIKTVKGMGYVLK